MGGMSGTLNASAASELRGTLKEKQELNGVIKEKQELRGIVASLGEDGGYYIPAVEKVDENTMQLSFVASKESMLPVAPQNIALPAGYTPQKGKDYQDGKDGASVTVQSVEKSTADGGSNVVTFSDGTKLIVKNGSKGSPGYTPVKGVDYDDGKDGEDGYSPVKGVDYDDGKDGYTPVKGIDYFTDADVDAVTAQVAGKVTAESIGAHPNTWMPSAADVGAHPNTWMPNALDVGAAPVGHVDDKSNPHGVTAEQAGARPDTWMPTASDVGARPDTWMPTASDIGVAPAIESADHSACYYRMVDDVQEWVNPPMHLDAEYRTAEHFYGKPVYRQVLSVGYLDAGERTINHGIANIDECIGCDFINEGFGLYTSHGTNVCFTQAQVYVKMPWAAGAVKFILSYTKN